jgi:hypothetical protein
MSITVETRRRGSSRGCLIVAIIVVVLLVACAGIPLAVMPLVAPGLIDSVLRSADLSGDELIRSQLGIETQELLGTDPARFDPFAGLAQARAFAGEQAELVGLEASGVRADGTMDLLATYTPAPSAEYRFRRRLAAAPPNAPPVGAGGSASGVWYEPVIIKVYQPGQRRQVQVTKGNSRVSGFYVNRGMTRETGQPVAETITPLPPPACSLALMWTLARALGAPPDAVAAISYTRDGYTFTIRGTPTTFRLGPDCQQRR